MAFLRAHRHQARFLHQAAGLVPPHSQPFRLQGGGHPAATVGLAGFRMHRLGVHLQAQAVRCCLAVALPVVIAAFLDIQHGAEL